MSTIHEAAEGMRTRPDATGLDVIDGTGVLKSNTDLHDPGYTTLPLSAEAVARAVYETDTTLGIGAMGDVFLLDRSRDTAMRVALARQNGDYTEMGRLLSAAWTRAADAQAHEDITDMEVG